ncbi:biotin--[acetyl-CoA-carboxylase] ligase [Magnetospira sp. QH-2]|uniref:biotin--[acetyl-CoA-carboxylase] ligase n=1 Tax=Magnetospira sp. (strain QH-2) TaxID=1288970 RepID=UPI0003E813EE|nr:biotin--[acetyl-CoA-carboxylase] ligase [Magnetospira sp. QH-2]CCQ73863.1 Biotin--[acetyl-CoA-carboxylase] synthetase [Magnetospira sp. QH-2]
MDSTNEEARRRAETGAPHFTVIQARDQTAGRGRRGRAWVSAPGNLHASVVLRPDCSAGEAAQLSFVLALAIADALFQLSGGAANATCKWPNDLMVDGKKICGILLESASTSGGVIDWLVAGFGINIVMAPGQTEYPVTSLADQGVTGVTVDEALAAVCGSLEKRFAAWQQTGFVAIRSDWLGRAHGLGEPITVRLAHDSLRGRFVDMDDTGALVLDTGMVRRHISAGDVFFD